MKAKAKNKPRPIVTTPPLEERLEALQSEIDTIIAELVDRRAAAAPGVPRLVIENIVIGRAGGCKCEALKLVRKANGEV
jgi:hypothetical protein